MAERRGIIVGASSGIGSALARVMSADGWELGLTARRQAKLEALLAELPGRGYLRRMDVTRIEEARETLRSLIAQMGGAELIVLNAGVSPIDPSWEDELEVLEVNVLGFVALANIAMSYFTERGSGHLVGISSIASLRGGMGASQAYSASKAFVSNYLEGLRLRADKRGPDITVTDVKPGYVETPMTAERTGMFWISPVEVAAAQIYTAIRKRKRHAYITRRWRLVAWLLKLIPYPVLARLA